MDPLWQNFLDPRMALTCYDLDLGAGCSEHSLWRLLIEVNTCILVHEPNKFCYQSLTCNFLLTNVGLSFHPKGQKLVKTMEGHWFTPPKKANTVLSAGKVMASVFWDADGRLSAKGTANQRNIYMHHFLYSILIPSSGPWWEAGSQVFFDLVIHLHVFPNIRHFRYTQWHFRIHAVDDFMSFFSNCI